MPAPNIRFRAVTGPYAHRTDCLSTPTPPALRPNEFLEVLAQGQRHGLGSRSVESLLSHRQTRLPRCLFSNP